MKQNDKIAIGVIGAGLATILLVKLVGGEHYNYDVNDDGIVDLRDLESIEEHLGESGPPGWIPEDVNSDGIIDTLDMIIVGQHCTGGECH